MSSACSRGIKRLRACMNQISGSKAECIGATAHKYAYLDSKPRHRRWCLRRSVSGQGQRQRQDSSQKSLCFRLMLMFRLAHMKAMPEMVVKMVAPQ